ncbi:MAG: cyclic lactone autoinducer peptide [Acetatifactor sp.]
MRFFRNIYIHLLAGLALSVSTMVANSTCCFIIRQEKMPEKAKKLRRF